jgi:hypothetical protein
MYPAAPDHLFGFFFIVKNSDRGSSVVFLGSQLYVRGWWWLAVELKSIVMRCTVLVYSFEYACPLVLFLHTHVLSYCFLSFH